MPSAPWSPSGVFTIVSLVTLCLLSFIVVLGSDNIINTQVRDTVYAFPKRDTPNHRRVFHHARAPLPQASAAPPSNQAQPDTPAATPTPVEPTPNQNPSPNPNPNPAKQAQPAPSPSPSPAPQPSPAPAPAPAPQPQPQSQPQPQPQPPAQSSPPAAAPSPATPPASNTPAAPPAASTSTSGPAIAPAASASLSQDSSSTQPQGKTVSNIDNYSATAFSYSYQPGSITALAGATSTTSSSPPNTFGVSTAAASPTAAAATGFFANKAGVGVTFGIVGIIVALGLILAIRMIYKRYRKSRDDKEVDEWFEKHTSGHGSSNWHGDGQYATNNDDSQYSSGNRRSAYGVSASDVAAAAATTSAEFGAYPDRSVHFGGRPASTASLGVVLPPSLNFAGVGGAGSALPSPKPSHSTLRNSLTPSQVGLPYAAPANTAYSAGAPYVPYPPAVHGQEQVNGATNGDPYYRTNATGVGAHQMGYAQ